jgi:hypothetical protein
MGHHSRTKICRVKSTLKGAVHPSTALFIPMLTGSTRLLVMANRGPNTYAPPFVI